ncbi:MAG: DUF819 family protein [Halieaceae bacterium]|jgi:uncharacterized membrane protein|nr:DUF819 family protein [Halieaceae bacterium]
MIYSSAGVMFTLIAIAAFWFYVEKRTRWTLFGYVPPLLFIYSTPILLSNTDILFGMDQKILVQSSPVYSGMREFGLPIAICLMLLSVNVPAAIRVMGGGVAVMLMGTAGVVIGGVFSYWLVHGFLQPDAWKAVGTLAGSWIGGTGNMAAAHVALEGGPEHIGLAVLADNLVYVVWLPILLGSRAFAEKFNAWARVPEDRIAKMEAASVELHVEERVVSMTDYLNLGVIALGVTWLSYLLAPLLPVIENVLSSSTWVILLVTSLSLALSVTPARHIPGSQNLAMAIIYVFVAGMGARAALEGLSQAPWFVLGAFVWIAIHGAFCLAGSYIFKVDVHSAAIASAANIGGAASAPVVAAYHRPTLVPVAILMALIGYAVGNYLAIFTGIMAGRVVGAG